VGAGAGVGVGVVLLEEELLLEDEELLLFEEELEVSVVAVVSCGNEGATVSSFLHAAKVKTTIKAYSMDTRILFIIIGFLKFE
jgi:hypothetical protein